MTLATNRVPGGTITAADINAIAAAVNAAGSVVGARAYRSAAFSIPTTTVTTVPLDAENFDTSGFHDNGTDPSRLTIPTTGYYLIVASGSHQSLSGQVQTRIVRNGSPLVIIAADAPSSGGQILALEVAALTAGDYIELAMYQTSGSTKAIGVGTAETWLAVVNLGV